MKLPAKYLLPILAAILLLTSCFEEEYEINPTAVTLSELELSLNPGQSATLTATVYPVNAGDREVTWSSSDPAVATVDNQTGVVMAVGEGTATIRASAVNGILSAPCRLTVTSSDGR